MVACVVLAGSVTIPPQVRIGLVGLGDIARTHLDVIASLPAARLTFTVDPRTAGPAIHPGAACPPHYNLVSEALSVHQPDVVVVATPTDTHVDLAIDVLTRSDAAVLVEKPLAPTPDAVDRLRAVATTIDLPSRLFTAHHFAFSPEVRWAAGCLTNHPEWGPITSITSAFYDPYAARGEQAFTSYTSSWADSGINQLSMLSRVVEPTAVTSLTEWDSGASAWCTCEYRSRGVVGTARLRTSWLAGSSSKETTLMLGESGVEIWLDHTAMTGFVARGSHVLATRDDDGQTPRKLAHYRPLYQSLLSGRPDPVLSYDTAVSLIDLHRIRSTDQADTR